MRNIPSWLVTAPILLIALGLSACTGTTSSETTPPEHNGEPELSITGAALTDPSVLLTSGSTPTPSEDATADTPDTEPANNPADSTDTSTDDLPIKRVLEGELVHFDNLKATDPDGKPVTFTFSTPLDANGRWQTTRGDAGEYRANITASDGATTTTQEVLIIVASTNHAPSLTVAAINVNEGETATLDIDASDTDGDTLTITISGWMDEEHRETTSEDIGTHTVTISAHDGFETTTKDVRATVNNINFAPVLSPLDDITVTEGETVRVLASATDKDADTLTYTFSEPLDEHGQWATTAGQEGKYSARATVSDGTASAHQDFDITVLHKNLPPTLTLEQTTITITEGETVHITHSASDPEGNDVTITFSGWMENDTYTTTFDDAGEHTVSVTARDGTDSTTQDMTIIVKDKNRPPVFDRNSFN